tara:strand:+ start:1631 stop:1771 length:141 start_codon:yes stop_codon:yes gene_type:complete
MDVGQLYSLNLWIYLFIMLIITVLEAGVLLILATLLSAIKTLASGK